MSSGERLKLLKRDTKLERSVADDQGAADGQMGRGGAFARRVRWALVDQMRDAFSYLGARSGNWYGLGALLVAMMLTLVSFNRFFEFDEAVVFSQTGGFAGNDAPARHMAASRELGPVVLIDVIRRATVDLAGVRLLWAAVTVGCIIAAFRAVGRQFGTVTGLIAGLLFGTFWVTQMLIASFYGSLIAALLALLAVMKYLELRDEQADGQLSSGLVLGLAFAGAFWMRHIESVLVLGALGLHLTIVKPGLMLRRRVAGLLTAAVAFFIAFVAPWMIDTVWRFGSLRERVGQALDQGYPTSWGDRSGEYLSVALGDSTMHRSVHGAPSWPGWVVAAVVMGAVVGLGLMFVRHWLRRSQPAGKMMAVRLKVKRGDETPEHMAFLLVLAIVSFGLFFFYSDIVLDRYLFFGVAFLAVPIAVGLRSLYEGIQDFVQNSTSRWSGHRLPAVMAVLTLGAWLVAQGTLVQTYEPYRAESADEVRRSAEVMRSLAGARDCAGVARWQVAELQLGSGCEMTGGGVELSTAEQRALTQQDAADVVFLVWPSWTGEDLQDRGAWEVVKRPLPNGRVMDIFVLDREAGVEPSINEG